MFIVCHVRKNIGNIRGMEGGRLRVKKITGVMMAIKVAGNFLKLPTRSKFTCQIS